MRTSVEPRAHLADLLAISGISATAFARALGSDRTRIDDWLSGAIEIPRTAQAWIAQATATDGTITTQVGELRIEVRRTGPRRR
jgi:DNA-binding transcriptional regulator YdaS (Cro superfamily)